MELQRATITAVAHYVPDKILSNKDLEKMVDTSDDWIVTRTGIRERRILEHGATSDMAVQAAQRVLANRGISAEELDLIIVATITSDMVFPATACLVQAKLGAWNAWAFDINAACSGFLYALSVGTRFVESGVHTKVLVIGADKMSSITDYTDRTTCILFGDAAAAVLLEPTDEKELGILDQKFYSDGRGAEFLHMKAGGSLRPASHETVEKRMHYLYQDGKSVFKVAVKGMSDVAVEIMERNKLTYKDIDWLVPHQANLRIVDATAERMGIDRSKVMINIEKYGNTTAATIPLCLSEWWHKGLLKRGHSVILAAFGAGYTWGAMYLKWSLENGK
ncbi:MAG: ketoacyl-ACP synthase III [Bacteroidetes bacterium]|nr:ketoacyl-ACP synthase III [Bacteroidota bacterium]